MSRSFRLLALAASLLAVSVVPAEADTQGGPLRLANSAPVRSTAMGDVPPNVLCEPGFENPVSSCWTKPAAFGTNHAAITGDAPLGSAYSADLCEMSSTEGCIGILEQRVAVPENLISAVISGNLRGTSDGAPGDCSNFVSVAIPVKNSEQGEVAGIFECPEHMDGDYSFYELDVTSFLEAYEGEMAPVWAVGQGLGTVHDFYVDDVYLSLVGDETTTVTKHERFITLNLKRHLKAKGALTTEDGPQACLKGAKIKIQKKSGTKWKTVGTTEGGKIGSYTKAIPDKPGKYRALAPGLKLTETKICKKAVSETKTHKH